MAKIVITIEDREGRVKVESNPSFETMVKMHVSGEGLTAAHGYAFAMINHVRKLSKDNDPNIKIKIPHKKLILPYS